MLGELEALRFKRQGGANIVQFLPEVTRRIRAPLTLTNKDEEGQLWGGLGRADKECVWDVLEQKVPADTRWRGAAADIWKY